MSKLKQFSKWFIRVSVIVWVAGAIYGGLFNMAQLAVSYFRPEAGIVVDLASYYNYIAIPLTAGGVAYLFKSAFESVTSMKQNYQTNYDEVHLK